MAAATFLNIALIWNEYVIITIAYYWTTTVLDALLPFVLLALQAFLAHSVYPSERTWLTALGALFAAGVVAYAYGFSRIARHPSDNRDIIRAMGVHRPLTMVFPAIGCGVCAGEPLWSMTLPGWATRGWLVPSQGFCSCSPSCCGASRTGGL